MSETIQLEYRIGDRTTLRVPEQALENRFSHLCILS